MTLNRPTSETSGTEEEHGTKRKNLLDSNRGQKKQKTMAESFENWTATALFKILENLLETLYQRVQLQELPCIDIPLSRFIVHEKLVRACSSRDSKIERMRVKEYLEANYAVQVSFVCNTLTSRHMTLTYRWFHHSPDNCVRLKEQKSYACVYLQR